MIELKNLTVAYGDNVIYNDFSFVFPQGVNVVVGASGSGKTTLLRAICGLTEHDGSCESDLAAMIFQDPCLAPTSALNNVAAVLKGKNARQTAMIALETCRISDKANRLATSLSGGEQQRVAIARAVAANRPVLLMDEPFQNLDLGVKRKLYRDIDGLLARTQTVLLVTHDVDEALLLADRVYLLSGKPAQLSQAAEVALPRSLRDEYSDEFVVMRKQLQQLLVQQCG